MLKFRRINYNEVEILKNMTLRSADTDELRAATGIKNTWVALKYCVQQSSEWIEIGYHPDTGEIITIFGLSKTLDHFEEDIIIGVPWMMASPNLIKHKKLLMRYSKKVIGEMLDQFPYLANYVDSRNVVHINWLKRMGFKLPEGMTIKINKVKFQYFYKER